MLSVTGLNKHDHLIKILNKKCHIFFYFYFFQYPKWCFCVSALLIVSDTPEQLLDPDQPVILLQQALFTCVLANRLHIRLPKLHCLLFLMRRRVPTVAATNRISITHHYIFDSLFINLKAVQLVKC